jgi:hypothetical protein
MCVQIALKATTVPALGCDRTIGLPSSFAATEPPTGISERDASAPADAPGEDDDRGADAGELSGRDDGDGPEGEEEDD